MHKRRYGELNCVLFAKLQRWPVENRRAVWHRNNAPATVGLRVIPRNRCTVENQHNIKKGGTKDFLNVCFAILYTSLLIFILLFIAVQISHCKTAVLFFKWSPYRKAFQTKIADLDQICTSCNVNISTMNRP